MPYNTASPKPCKPDKSQGIQASRHPSIPDCRNPLFDHLKGVTDPCRRTPQGISRRGPPAPLPPPLALKLVLPPARESQMPHLTGNRHPSIRASEHPGIHSACTGMPNGSFDRQQAPQQLGIRAPRHPGIQASIPQVPEVGGRGGSL